MTEPMSIRIPSLAMGSKSSPNNLIPKSPNRTDIGIAIRILKGIKRDS